MIQSSKLLTHILIDALTARTTFDSTEIEETCSSVDLTLANDSEIEQIHYGCRRDSLPYIEISVFDNCDREVDKFGLSRYTLIEDEVEIEGEHADIIAEIITLYRAKILSQIAGENNRTKFDSNILRLFRSLHTGYVLDEGVARLPGLLSNGLNENVRAIMFEEFEAKLEQEGLLDRLEGIEI